MCRENEKSLLRQNPDLLAKAKEKTDLQAAQEMQKAKTDLFELFNIPKRKQQA